MKNKLLISLITLAACLKLSSCAANSHAEHQAGVGGAVGAGLGGIIGHQSGKAKEGAMAGAAVGAILGHMSGTEKDRQESNNAGTAHPPYHR